jgi:integrase
MAALTDIPHHRGTRPHVIDAIHFVRQSAVRRGECVKLDWKDVNLVERTAKLLNTKSKSNNKKREIPLPFEAWRLLLARASAIIDPSAQKNWAEMEESELNQAAIDLTNRKPPEMEKKPVFINGRGARLGADALTQAWNDARARAGLVESADKKERVRIHDLRHTRITELGNSTELTMMAVARIAGHTNTDMLQRYFNPTAADMVGKVDAGDRKRNAPLPKSAIEDIVDTLMSLSGDERSQVMSRLMQRMDGR